jgi:hypothetical protein
MKFLLLITIIQHGHTDIFKEFYKTKVECVKAKEEALMHDNEITKVTAKCLKVPSKGF